MDIFGLIALANSQNGGAGKVFHFKGVKSTVNLLPIQGEEGGVYKVEEDNSYYAWNGTSWENIGNILTADQAAELINGMDEEVDDLKSAVNTLHISVPTYGGRDLLELFGSAEDIHEAVAAGDFSKIHIGDYFPVTLNGSYTDFARFTVPSGTTYYSDAALTTEAGTTEAAAEGEYQSATAIKFKISGTTYYAAIGDCTAGFEKSMNETLLMEVAAINPYLRMGDTELTAQHVLLCSRDCMANTMQMRCANNVWYDTEAVNPWKGSALHATLNDPDKGIIKLVEATAVGPYVFKGPNNKGMRAMLPTMAAGAGSQTNWAWTDRGRLFLPTEREVYGANAWANAGGYEAGNLYNKWPIFDGSARHVIKGSGDGGGRCNWWLESAYSATGFALVNSYGHAYGNNNAAAATIRVPLCFLFT